MDFLSLVVEYSMSPKILQFVIMLIFIVRIVIFISSGNVLVLGLVQKCIKLCLMQDLSHNTIILTT